MNKVYLFLLPLLLIAPLSAAAQTLPIGDTFETYQRIFPMSDSLQSSGYNLRPLLSVTSNHGNYQAPNHPWFQHSYFSEGKKLDQNRSFFQTKLRIYSPELTTSFNSRMPFGINDGAMWQGKGINQAVTAGVRFSYGPLKIDLRPTAGYAQNREFDLHPIEPHSALSEFATHYRNRRIDNPQRFGDEPYSWFHPGQSSVELQYYGFATGISTKNIRTGPAYLHPLHLGNQAPGYEHLFLGTYKPVQTPIGDFEFKLFGGRLYESDYYDSNPDNDRRFINGLILTYAPRFLPGLTVGGVRTRQDYYPEDGVKLSDFTAVFGNVTRSGFASDEDMSGNTDFDEIMTVFARWAFPEQGFETYLEWGRNDNAVDMRDIFLHAEHARAYTLGASKRFTLSEQEWLHVITEITQIQTPRSSLNRTNGPWYKHSSVFQGWTNRGQNMANSIGTGSNSQHISADYYAPFGKIGLSITRVEHDNDFIHRSFSQIRRIQTVESSPSDRNEYRQTELRFGLHGLLFTSKNIEVESSIYNSFFRNRYHVIGNSAHNLHTMVKIRYTPSGLLR